jgi:hypothetical protein
MRRLSLLVVLSALLFPSCDKQEDAQTQSTNLTESPADAQVSSETASAATILKPLGEKPADARATGVADSADVMSEPTAENYVSFPSVGVKLPQPEGFQREDSFYGFGQPETQASVMAVKLPGPFAEVTAGFTKEQMGARGWTLLEKQELEIESMQAILVHFEQPAAGKVFRKWSLVFGTPKETRMVTATFPRDQEQALSERLKSVLLNVRLERAAPPEPGSDLPFTVSAPANLKLTSRMSKMLVYTKDGVMPAKSPQDPLLIIAPSLGNVTVDDRRQFALQRIQQTAHTEEITVTSIEPISIDSLTGFELLADARDEESKTPLILYQVILFDEAGYILIQGLVGAELQEGYLAEFKSVARSLRRKGP